MRIILVASQRQHTDRNKGPISLPLLELFYILCQDFILLILQK